MHFHIKFDKFNWKDDKREESILLQYICRQVEWIHDDHKGELNFLLLLPPEADQSMIKLLDAASQLDLSFSGESNELGSFISLILRSGNGELAILIPKQDWVRFLEEPDRLILDFGQRFETDFLPVAFLKYVDELIDRVNQGEESPFLLDIIEVFAEEE